MAKLKVQIPFPPFAIELEISEIQEFSRSLLQSLKFLKDRNGEYAGKWHIVSKLSGKAVDVLESSLDDCAPIIQYKLHGGNNQTWKLVSLPDGYFHIFASHSGKVLDVDAWKHDDMATVWQYKYHGGENQQWRIEDAGDGFVYIKARHSGKVLDVQFSSQDDFARIIQFQQHTGDNQKWKLFPVSSK